MGYDTDYRAVNIPDEKDPAEYTWVERRADILDTIEDAGHPRAVKQTQLAERYGVSQGQISQDFDRIREYIVDTMDVRRVESITQLVYEKAIKELMADGKYTEAVKVTEKWNDWLFDKGVQERAPRRTESDIRMSELSHETDSYEIIESDDAIDMDEFVTVSGRAVAGGGTDEDGDATE